MEKDAGLPQLRREGSADLNADAGTCVHTGVPSQRHAVRTGTRAPAHTCVHTHCAHTKTDCSLRPSTEVCPRVEASP